MSEVIGELLILAIIIISVTCFLFLGEKVKISAISIELIVGMVLGNFLFTGAYPNFPTIDNMHWLRFLANFGFILLLFLAGLELNILFLKKYFQKSVILIVAMFIGTFLVGTCVGTFLGIGLMGSFLVGLTFAGASIGVVFPLITELGIAQKRLGQILITSTMALEIICILIISFIDYSTLSELNIMQFVLVILIIILFFIVIVFGINRFWHYLEGRTSTVKVLAWEMRITFALLMGLVVVTGIILDIEEIIGAFLAGMIMGQSKSAPQLKEKIGSIGYGFFIPIFFFVTGMKMDISYFSNLWFIVSLILIILVLFGIKIVSGLLGSKLIGFPWKAGLFNGIILIPSLGVGIAAAELGNKSLLLGSQDFTLLISIIIISAILIPIFTRFSAKKLIPNLISKQATWRLHLEHDLGIYLDESYVNIFEEIKVNELPQKPIIHLNLDTPIIKILEYMESYHQMDFPVVSLNNQFLGIVEFDDIKKFIIDGKLNETAGTIMRKEFIFVLPDDPLSAALDKMRLFDVELLPIVEITTLQLIGTVSREHILRFIRLRALGASISPSDFERPAPKKKVN
ncbi:MAG TPA: cation:proton antiporter [Candidatus Deferrimicrobium sp.]|nr:cation:proton antiporter [Candidatus Deferrimicrobium sp.]